MARKEIKFYTEEEFLAAMKKQASCPDDVVFKCPMCATLQTRTDLLAAGVEVEDSAANTGFNCVGNFTGKGSPRKEKGKNRGCNWRLNGLRQMHTTEVILKNGELVPIFDLATPEEAEAYRLLGE